MSKFKGTKALNVEEWKSLKKKLHRKVRKEKELKSTEQANTITLRKDLTIADQAKIDAKSGKKPTTMGGVINKLSKKSTITSPRNPLPSLSSSEPGEFPQDSHITVEPTVVSEIPLSKQIQSNSLVSEIPLSPQVPLSQHSQVPESGENPVTPEPGENNPVTEPGGNNAPKNNNSNTSNSNQNNFSKIDNKSRE